MCSSIYIQEKLAGVVAPHSLAPKQELTHGVVREYQVNIQLQWRPLPPIP